MKPMIATTAKAIAKDGARVVSFGVLAIITGFYIGRSIDTTLRIDLSPSSLEDLRTVRKRFYIALLIRLIVLTTFHKAFRSANMDFNLYNTLFSGGLFGSMGASLLTRHLPNSPTELVHI